MKKVFSISVIAALAILPMVANAETGDIVAGAPKTAVSESQAENTVTAGERQYTNHEKKFLYKAFLIYFSDEKTQNKSLDLFC